MKQQTTNQRIIYFSMTSMYHGYQSFCRFFPSLIVLVQSRDVGCKRVWFGKYIITVFVKADEDEKLDVGQNISLLRRKSAVSGCSEKVNNFSEKTFNSRKSLKNLLNCTFFILNYH